MNGQLVFFPVPPEPQPPEQIGPLSHRHDPQTSRDAAEHLKRSGKLAAQQEAVLQALRQCDGATHAELGESMGVHWLTPARRLPELERAGQVKKGQPRTCKVKASRCTTWWIVEMGE